MGRGGAGWGWRKRNRSRRHGGKLKTKKKNETKRLVLAARQRNASSLPSLRPVPYTLRSFPCSHVDGLRPRRPVRFPLRVKVRGAKVRQGPGVGGVGACSTGGSQDGWCEHLRNPSEEDELLLNWGGGWTPCRANSLAVSSGVLQATHHLATCLPAKGAHLQLWV